MGKAPIRFHAASIIYFNAVRRDGSFRAAARSLNVASSAINRQILKLETEIGAPLFERVTGGLRLTPAGDAFSRHVVAVLQDFDRLRHDIDTLSKGQAGSINLAIVESICESIIPGAIAEFHARAPRVSVEARVLGSLQLPAMIANGDADIGVGFAISKTRELQRVSAAEFRLGAVVAAGHELADRRRITLKECANFPLILPDPSLGTHRLLQPLIGSLDEEPGAVVRANSIELMRELAEKGVGVSFHTIIGIERLLQLKRLAFIPLDAGGPVWSDLGIYVRRGRLLAPHFDTAISIISNAILQRKEEEDRQFGVAKTATAGRKN
jgi:DNA-binding transcriptional LysR family regulator